MSLLRGNPALMVSLVALVIVAIVFVILAVVMTRAGASLRPLAFFGVYLGIIGGPQLLFHVAQGSGWIPKRSLTRVAGASGTEGYREVESALAVTGSVFANPQTVFPGADPDLISDLTRLGPSGPYGDAQVAQMAILPPAGTAVVARYANPAAARVAAEGYLRSAAGYLPDPAPDGAVLVSRPVGDVRLTLTAGRTLIALTGPDERTVRSALAASRVVAPIEAPVSVAADPGATFWLYRPAVLAGLVLLLVVVATLWFFKGSTWASSLPPVAGAAPVSGPELRRRLLAINELDAPYAVQEETPGGRIVVTWRFADARWVELARVRGMRATHRILIELDESKRVARPTEQVSRVDWSAGLDGAGVSWRTMAGIVFFQYEHQRVFGLQLDPQGRFTPQLSYAYTFNLQEMKAPFTAAVTTAGWGWRPTAWHAPRWLRWLTE